MNAPKIIKTIGNKIASIIGPAWLLGLLVLALSITIAVREMNRSCPSCQECQACEKQPTQVVKTVEKIFEEPVSA